MSLFRRRIISSISISGLVPEIEIPRNIVRQIDSNIINSISLDPNVIDNNITFTRYYDTAYRYTPESVSLDKSRDLAIKAVCGYANETRIINYKNFNNISVSSDNVDVLTVEISQDGVCSITTVNTGTANITVMDNDNVVGIYPVRVSNTTSNTITLSPDRLSYNLYYAGPIGTSPAYWAKDTNNISVAETSSSITLTPPPYFGNEIKLGIYYIEISAGDLTCIYPKYPNLITIIDGEEGGEEDNTTTTVAP